jgi:hypothetical protein
MYSRSQPLQRSLILSGLKELGYDVGEAVEKICQGYVDGEFLDTHWFDRSRGNIWSFIALAGFSHNSYQSMVDDVIGDSLKQCHTELSVTELLWLNRFQFANGELLPKLALKRVTTAQELISYLHILSMRDENCSHDPVLKKWVQITNELVAA